jgi:CheY-like chemotaxis protein
VKTVGLTVLVVEDNGDDVELIRVAFRKIGFEERLEMVWRPGEAICYLKGEGKYSDRAKFPFPDLVLLDHKMPGDGWEVIEWVRERADLNLLPVVVFSGSDDPSHQKKAAELGANAYEIKPQSFDNFIATLGRICEFWLRGGGCKNSGERGTSP